MKVNEGKKVNFPSPSIKSGKRRVDLPPGFVLRFSQ
jgi:hypothetical protein